MHKENMMNTVNFNQLLCKNVSGEAENLSGIFDTLVCEKGINTVFLCIFASQILNDAASNYDKYYYRIVLRQFGDPRKSYRVDSGLFWNNTNNKNSTDGAEQHTRHRSTRAGTTEKLIIEYGHNFEIPGQHEIDLYVKKIDENVTKDNCDSLTVKELDLVSIYPFNVIFPNCE